MKHPKIVILETPEALAQEGAEIFLRTSRLFTKEGGLFTVALSGGATPRAMHRLLGKAPLRSQVPWDRIHIFWGDERCVPYQSPWSSFGSARKDFLEGVGIPDSHVHPMPTNQEPEKGARLYETELADFFRSRPRPSPALDLAFLGMGVDGHTASLFPGRDVLNEDKRWVVAVKAGGEPAVPRLTMTIPFLNRAGQIVFLVSGKRKAHTVREILESDEERYPARRIHPVSGRITWLLDSDAASLLSGDPAHG